MQRLVSCLIENCLHYKDQPVNDGREIIAACCEKYMKHINTVSVIVKACDMRI